ncbi:ankyrin repeat domain-containing protein [Candidatus Dependentiae bacterium]
MIRKNKVLKTTLIFALMLANWQPAHANIIKAFAQKIGLMRKKSNGTDKKSFAQKIAPHYGKIALGSAAAIVAIIGLWELIQFISANTSVDDNGRTKLYRCCMDNDIKKFKSTFKYCIPATINRASKSGETPLLIACDRNNLEMVKSLLPHCTKETINMANAEGATPLAAACGNRNVEMAELLLPHCTEETINKNYSTFFVTGTLLSLACFAKNLEVVTLLLPYYTKETINKPCTQELAPLHLACKKGSKEIVELLLKNGAEINNVYGRYGRYKMEPLSWACDSGNLELVTFLIEKGARVDRESLRCAIYSRDINIFKLVLSHASDFTINWADYSPRKRVSLHHACDKDNLEIVTLLLERGATRSINKADANGDTPLSLACKNGNLEIITLLLKKGAIVDGSTSLLRACENSNLEIVTLLLPYYTKETINTADKCGETPLYAACSKGNTELVKLLLEKGAKHSINKANHREQTPLWISFWSREGIELAKLLLLNGAKVRQEDLDRVRDQTKLKDYLKAVFAYDENNTLQKKHAFINSKKNNPELFNFLIKLSFSRSLEATIEENNTFQNFMKFDKLFAEKNWEKTVFHEICKNNTIRPKDKKIEFNKIFGVSKKDKEVPKTNSYENFVKKIIKKNNLYFAKRFVKEELGFRENLNKMRNPEIAEKNKNMEPDVLINFS